MVGADAVWDMLRTTASIYDDLQFTESLDTSPTNAALPGRTGRSATTPGMKALFAQNGHRRHRVAVPRRADDAFHARL
jgi:hypothetical protein